MAYLKSTYIDGDLSINGALYVQRLIDTSGLSVPYLEDENASVQNRLVKFSDATGGLTNSAIEELIEGTSLEYNIISIAANVTLNFNGKNITLSDMTSITIDTEISEIYVESSDVTALELTTSIPSSGRYYTDGTNYYIPKTSYGYQNWPDGICYTDNLTTV